MDGTRCKNYCGVSCVDGSCLRALTEDYEDMIVPGIYKCEDCWLYKGCEDCAFNNTAYCIKETN